MSTFLKLSQIQNLIQMGSQWVCPEDLTGSILFTSDELKKLVSRSKELEAEELVYQKGYGQSSLWHLKQLLSKP